MDVVADIAFYYNILPVTFWKSWPERRKIGGYRGSSGAFSGVAISIEDVGAAGLPAKSCRSSETVALRRGLQEAPR
jgi:hypothetical protein